MRALLYTLILMLCFATFFHPYTHAQSCPLHYSGDANCNNLIEKEDFEIFRREFVGEVTTRTADFNSDGKVSVVDFELWRRSFSNVPIPQLTVTPVPTLAGCSYPAQVLDLTNWKITLPIGSSSPLEIKQPQLKTYAIDPWFKVNTQCTGVQFRAHTSSPVTTSNSSYPRSELREMINDGTGNAAWSNTSGIHTMFIDEAIISVPKGKKHVVAGQVHDSSNDIIVIRLEYPKLFIDIGGSDGPTLDAAYTLGKRFNVTFIASAGKINIFYNGSITPSHTLTKNISGSYFKAGAYTQSNCTKEQEYGSTCATDNYGEVIIYGLTVKHQ